MNDSNYKTRCIGRAAAVVCAVLVLWSEGQAVEFEQIERAWQSRQDATRSLQATWQEAWVNLVMPPAGSSGPAAKAEEVSHVAPELRFFLDGDKARFETYTISGETHDLLRSICVFDQSNGYSRSLLSTPEFPSGIIRDSSTAFFSAQMSVLPLLLGYRGCDNRLCAHDLSRFRLDDSARIDVSGGVLLSYADTGTQVAWYLAVDPALDYAPMRLVSFIGEAQTFDLAMTFGRSTAGKLVPSGWKGAMFDKNGSVLCAVRSQVKEVVLNAPVDQSVFRLDFPDGTMVDDIRTDEDGYRLNKRHVVVNGKEREITREEILRGASYQDLMSTSPGNARPSLPFHHARLSWLIALNVAVIVALAIVIWRRASLGEAH